MGFNLGDGFKWPAQLYSGIGGAFGGGSKGDGPGGVGASGIPKFGMKKTQDFIKPQENIQIGGGQNAVTNRYNAIRDRVGGQAGAALTGNISAVQRRFAAMGASGAGAQVKAEQMARDAGERQKNDAMLNVDVAESGEIANRDLAQADMDFKNRVFSFESSSKMHELDLAERQQQIDSATTEFNSRLASEQSKPPKQGMLSSLLGDLL